MKKKLLSVTVEQDGKPKNLLLRINDIQSVVDHGDYRLILMDNPYGSECHQYEVMQTLEDIHSEVEEDI